MSGVLKNTLWSKIRFWFFLLSSLILSWYPFWFGLDFFKTGYPNITKFLESHWTWFIVPAIWWIIWKFFYDGSIKKKLEKSEKENEQLKWDLVELSEALKDLSNDLLRDFSRDNLSSEDTIPMRISLYVSNKANDKLYCVSRYSKNQKFCSISNGKIYWNNGIIGKVWVEWNQGACGIFDNNIPDTTTNKGKEYATYQLETYKITKESIASMKMKSRLYYAYRVQSDTHNLGVILIESTSPNRYTKDELDTIIKDLEHRLLIVLKSTKNYLWQPFTYSDNQM